MGGYSDKSHVGMMQCFYCGDSFGVAIDRRLRDSLPREAVYDMNPCLKCESIMESGGLIVIGTSTSHEALERQRQEAKREWDSKPPYYRKKHPFGLMFIPQATRLGVVGISQEAAQRLSDATNGMVRPGGWTFVEQEVWDTYFADAAREHEQSQKSTT